MKIIAIGMNYSLHCQELHADEALPQEPVIFMKPDSALLKDSKPFFIPDFCEQVDYETELVVRISRLGKNIAERFASRYYDAVTVGIDFTARDLQRKSVRKASPGNSARASTIRLPSVTGCLWNAFPIFSRSVSIWISTEIRYNGEIRQTCCSGLTASLLMSAVSVR